MSPDADETLDSHAQHRGKDSELSSRDLNPPAKGDSLADDSFELGAAADNGDIAQNIEQTHDSHPSTSPQSRLDQTLESDEATKRRSDEATKRTNATAISRKTTISRSTNLPRHPIKKI